MSGGVKMWWERSVQVRVTPRGAEHPWWRYAVNAFCPTGVGGGVDPTCSPGGGGAGAAPGGGGAGKGGASKKASDYKPARPSGRDTMERHTSAEGRWTPERQQLHKEIVSSFKEGKTPVKDPVAYVMRGGPASGKSSALAKLSIPDNVVHIDPDAVKAKIPEYREMTAAGNQKAASFSHEESSHVSKVLQAEASSEGYNTLLDGTGDGSIDKLEAKIQVMKNSGQRVVANYVTVDTETAVERSNARGAKTGRYVPESFIRANHADVSRVVPQAIARGLFDDFTLWDTNGKDVLKVATAEGNKLTIHDQKAWDSFLAKGR